MSFFTRTLSRLRREDHGFSLMETVVALGVLFISLLVLARTAAVGFTDIALSRQRTQANQIANKVLEQVRGLSYERVGKGLDTNDLTGDPNIITTCPDGPYYRVCPGTDPEAEKIVHSADPGADAPLVPHRTSFGEADGYTTDYTAAVYVTHAKAVPQTGAYRVTVAVTWPVAARPGISSSVTTQSLLYTPEGTTDATTGGGTAPFFYGTGSIGRAPVTMTPNPGVAGGTGLQGLPPWDSMSVNLYGLENSIQQQALTRAESRVVLTGASKVVDGVETLEGGDTAEALADSDPATAPTTSSSPPSLMQSAVSTSLSGGGNSIEVEAASGTLGGGCPSNRPTPIWLSGLEGGHLGGTSLMSQFDYVGSTSWASADSAVKRSGNFSLKIVGASTSNFVQKKIYTNPPTNSTYGNLVVARLALRMTTPLPTNNTPLVTFIPAAGGNGSLYYRPSTNRLSVTFDGVNFTDATTAFQADTWYVLDFRFSVGASPRTLEWSINGTPQGSVSKVVTASLVDTIQLSGGPSGAGAVWYDDIFLSATSADYPIGDGRIERLLPDGMGPGLGNPGGGFYDDDATLVDSTSWQRLDEAPPSSDYIFRTSGTSAANYVDVTFGNTTETCINGVAGTVSWRSGSGNKANNVRASVVDGGTERIIDQGDRSPEMVLRQPKTGRVLPATAPWTTAAVNGLIGRFTATDIDPAPVLDHFILEYDVSAAGGETPEGNAGTETGSTVSTTAAGAAAPCGAPTQLDGRACAYAQEDYSTAGPPHLSLKAGAESSDSLMARLYRYTPSTTPGSISYVWGRRTAGGGGVGTLKETAVRYPGTHTFAPIMPFVGSAPPGWQGYWLKYDAGSAASSVSAEAGIGASAPNFTSAGTISYWNGTGYTSMTPPPLGGPIDLAPVDYTGGVYRTRISGSLATSPSGKFPPEATGIADRTEARATLGSPVSGIFTYQVIYVPTNEVVGDFTISVDLGTLTATARYAP